MNSVLREILAIVLWNVTIICGAVFAYIFVINGNSPFADRVGGVGLATGVIACILTCYRN